MSNRIQDLEPVTHDLCVKFIAECTDHAIALRLTHTLRTMDEQLHLWAQGRVFQNGVWIVADAGKIVTKARPGESPHNFGMAFDICFNGPDPYLGTYEHEHGGTWDPRWLKIGELGVAVGLAWGGNWKSFKDRPHFERPDWKTARADVVWP